MMGDVVCVMLCVVMWFAMLCVMFSVMLHVMLCARDNVKLFLGLGLKPYTHFLEDRAFSPQWRV